MPKVIVVRGTSSSYSTWRLGRTIVQPAAWCGNSGEHRGGMLAHRASQTIFAERSSCETNPAARMKRPKLASLVAVVSLTSCSTMHDAAVSTFRVVDTPNRYLRRKLEVDEEPSPTPATSTVQAASSNNAASRPQQPYPVQSQPASSHPVQQPPPVQTQRQVAAQQRAPEPPAEHAPSATPPAAQKERTTTARTVSAHTTEPKPSATPRAASSTPQAGDLPYAKPVPGKPGYVFSPYDKSGGYVDVTGYAPGQKVKDPYTGKIFLVP